MIEITTLDGLKIHGQAWDIPHPRAGVVIVHGLGEHGGRYVPLAAALNQAGFAAYTLDHRGHGRSAGEPRAWIKDIQTYVDDLKLFWDQVQADHPSLPWFMLGHSMGGLIATCFTLRFQAEMRGLITSGAALAPPAATPRLMIPLGKMLGQAAPRLPMLALDANLLSHDPAVVRAYQNDPLVYQGKLWAGTVSAIFRAADGALGQAHTLQLPLLILHGDQDKIISAAGSQRLYAQAGSRDKKLVIYPLLYHEILNEPEKAQIQQEIIAWLNDHL